MSPTMFDLAIVGAGPAGLAATALARSRGLSVVVFDEQPSPGGLMYRAITTTPVRRREVLGLDYWHGAALAESFRRSGATYLPSTTVWGVARRRDGFEIGVSAGRPSARQSTLFEARTLVVATGALERPFPIPGGTLPGVITAGGAQLLLKSSGLVMKGPTVLAGLGPLLWLVAWQTLNAGGRIDALLETIPRGRLAEAMRHAPGFMFSAYLAKGLELVRHVRRRVRVVEHVERLEAIGDDRVRAVRYDAGAGVQEIEADLFALHQGVVPDTQLANALGCELRWNPGQAAFEPVVDRWGETTQRDVFVAGDGAGIAGALAAEARGRLAAIAAAHRLGRLADAERDRLAAKEEARLANALRGRAFLDALYRPAPSFRLPDGDTIVCRCEEVSAAAIREAARGGATGPNQGKAFLRCGMGPCQGRQCGPVVSELIAAERRTTPAEVGTLHARFPVKPVTLAEIACWPTTDEAMRSVERDDEREVPPSGPSAAPSVPESGR